MLVSGFSDLTDVPRHMIDSMENNLWGAIFCLGGGLALLIAAIVFIGFARRKSGRDPFEK